MFIFCEYIGDHRDSHVLTHSFPTRRSSDLTVDGRSLGLYDGTFGGNPNRTIISESVLYKLALRAQKTRPEVEAFQRWVTRVVLPAIRKDGAYISGEEKEIGRAHV